MRYISTEMAKHNMAFVLSLRFFPDRPEPSVETANGRSNSFRLTVRFVERLADVVTDDRCRDIDRLTR